MKKIIIILMLFPTLSFSAMDKDRCGDAIVVALKVINSNIAGASETALKTLWKAICDELIKEIQNNADIVMGAGDFNITPGTFLDSTAAPITGLGANSAFSLTGKIQ